MVVARAEVIRRASLFYGGPPSRIEEVLVALSFANLAIIEKEEIVKAGAAGDPQADAAAPASISGVFPTKEKKK